jgi:hypothetical protein
MMNRTKLPVKHQKKTLRLLQAKIKNELKKLLKKQTKKRVLLHPKNIDNFYPAPLIQRLLSL